MPAPAVAPAPLVPPPKGGRRTPPIRRGLAAAGLAVGLLSGAGPGPLPAQMAGTLVVPTVEDRIARGDWLHGRLQPLAALRSYERALADDPDRYEALWKGAREAVSLGMLAASDASAGEWFTRGAAHARRARDARPDAAEGHHWLAVALGWIALDEGPRERVRLATTIREEALAALAADPDHAGAHHVLGRWHAEVERTSGIARFFARTLLGGRAFEEATWEAARTHLERAVELEPDVIIHRVALARVYLDVGEPELARTHLGRALDLPVREPTDPLQKEEARELLAELG